MKRYFLKLALVALSVGTLVSCEEDTVTYGGANFVSFDNVATVSYPFFENRGISEIPVNMAFPQSGDLTVSFTVESDVAVAGVHYNVLTPNNITIPAGETTGFIRIEVLDNTILDDSKILKITLTGTSDANTVVGLADPASKAKNFLIVNNDCTTTAFNWFGNLDFETDYNGDVTEGTAVGNVTDEGTCNVLLIKGDFAGLGREQAAPIRFTFTPDSNQVPDTSGAVKADEQLWCEQCLTSDGITYNLLYSATGVYQASGKIIVTGSTKIDGLTTVTETTVFTNAD
jgi:hypothetical protein